MGNYCVIDIASAIVINVIIWDGESEWSPPDGCIAVPSAVAGIGWTYKEGEFTPPPVEPPTPAELLASQSAILQSANQLAAAQKTALTNRIGVINDAIEFDEATPDELAELPARQAQLTAWKRYAVLLGRVTTQSGWYESVDWPAQPADGMDLSVSGVSGRTSLAPSA